MGIDFCGSPCECASARCDYDGCRVEACKYSDTDDVPKMARALGWLVPEDSWDDWICPKHAAPSPAEDTT